MHGSVLCVGVLSQFDFVAPSPPPEHGGGSGVVAAAASRLTHNENEHPPVVKLSFDLQTSTYFLPSIFRLLLN